MRSTLPLTNRFCSQIIFSRYLNSSKLGWKEDILQITERRKTELRMKIVARMRTVTWHSSSWSSDHSPLSIGPIVESILHTAPQMLDSNATGWYLENVIVSIYCSIPGRHKYLRSAATIQSYPRTTDIYSCLQLSKHLRGHSTESLAPSTDFPLCILHSPPHYRHSSLELWHTTSSYNHSLLQSV